MRYTAGVQKRGRIAALSVNKDFSGCKPFCFQLIGIDAAVLCCKHAHRKSVQKFVLAVFQGVVRALDGDNSFDDGCPEKHADVIQRILLDKLEFIRQTE